MIIDDENLLNRVFNLFDLLNVQNKKICLAVSGGVDSLFLAFATKIYFNHNTENLYTLIIDHNLRENSKEHCIMTKNSLSKFGFQHINIIEWKHDLKENFSEEDARISRYKIINDYCLENEIKTTLLGHHLDDQIETFFLNIFRGSGIIGLGCMPKILEKNQIKYIRPLLDIRKSEITRFMEDNNIKWCEDQTNQNEKFTRNKIRKILNQIGIDDIVANRIGTSIKSIQLVNDLIQNQTEEIFEKIFIKSENKIKFSTKEFQSLHQHHKISNMYKIFSFFQTEKPRFDQISDIISLINGINLEEIQKRKLHLSGIDFVISNQEVEVLLG